MSNGLSHRPEDCRRQPVDLAVIAGKGLDDDELVAAEARHEASCGHLAQPPSRLDQQRIAQRMAQRVVDCFEPVQIKAEQGEDVLAA